MKKFFNQTTAIEFATQAINIESIKAEEKGFSMKNLLTIVWLLSVKNKLISRTIYSEYMWDWEIGLSTNTLL